MEHLYWHRIIKSYYWFCNQIYLNAITSHIHTLMQRRKRLWWVVCTFTLLFESIDTTVCEVGLKRKKEEQKGNKIILSFKKKHESWWSSFWINIHSFQPHYALMKCFRLGQLNGIWVLTILSWGHLERYFEHKSVTEEASAQTWGLCTWRQFQLAE